MTITKHTTVNVSLIHDAFFIPQLNRTRSVWMYKPDGYDESGIRYPVIYMHDGQNLFGEATAFDKEWEIDKTLQSLFAECIVVGIESSEQRMTEYNSHDNKKHGTGEGKAYLDFIVSNLKPYVDKHYKTLPGREHTFMAGSSMGGLITLFGAICYPDVFGKVGIFSPALWIAPGIYEEIKSAAKNSTSYPQQLFFYGGENEGGNMVQNILDAVNVMKEYPQYTIQMNIDEEGEHCENCWRDKFSSFYRWLDC